MVMEEGRSPSIMAKAKWSPKLAFLLADLAVGGARPGETERETKEKRTRRCGGREREMAEHWRHAE